jgi:hypothetical protein
MVIEPIHSLRVEAARPTLDTVDLVTFGQQQLGQIRSILTSDASDKGYFPALNHDSFQLK